MTEYIVPCKGIVAYSQHDWKYEDLLTREPDEDEFLIEMIATGVCHTDISGYGGIYPRVLGHEGTTDTHSSSAFSILICSACPA
jgi:Zn-dependent alcohol dehydrogenase